MQKKYLKYILLTFAVFFGFNMKVRAYMICKYDYTYRSDTPSLSKNMTINIDTRESKITVEMDNKSTDINYGKNSIITLDDGNYFNINVKSSLKSKVSKFKNCSDSIGVIENSETLNLVIQDSCVGYAGEVEKCSSLPGTLISGTPESSSKKTSIKFSTSDKLSGVLGVNENGDYYLKLDADTNVFTASPSKEFTFTFKNRNYRIDPDTKDKIFKSKGSVYLYTLDSGNGGTDKLLSLNKSKDGFTTTKDVFDNTTYEFKITDKKSDLNALDFKGICSEDSVRKVFQILGYVLLIVKIAVPLLLIIFGIINLFKVVVSGEQDSLNKTVKSLVIKVIAAIVIFILPTIIYYVINLVDGSSEGTEPYANCKNCLFEPSSC